MKIVHICCGAILENSNYQEQDLAKQNLQDGHNVIIICSTENINSSGKCFHVKPNIMIDNGIKLYRLKCFRLLGNAFARRMLFRYKLISIIKQFNPDVIFHHGISLDLIRIAKYINKKKHIKLFVDNHADFNNSAHNFFSLYILHKIIYRTIIQYALKYITTFFYITYETKVFANINYLVPENKMDYLPLGGFILNDEEIKFIRMKYRRELNIRCNEILAIHSGKLDKLKNTTELVSAFNRVQSTNIKLVIIGNIEKLDQITKEKIRSSKNIFYLGWMPSEQLNEYLYACDLYIQPGSQSITMQRSICAGNAVALYPHKSHDFLLGESYFKIKSEIEIESLLIDLSSNPNVLEQMKSKSILIRNKYLDYKVSIRKMYL